MNATGTDTNSTSITIDETLKIGDTTVKPGDDVVAQDNATKNLNDTMNVGDNMVKSGDDMTKQKVSNVVLSPLKQTKEGVVSKDVICKEGLELAFKLNGQAACVKATSVEKLITCGWTQ